MRVLFLADAMNADIAGGSRVVADALAAGLAAHGHEVTFLVPRHKPDAPAEERLANGAIRIVRYNGGGGAKHFIAAGRDAAARLHAEHPFDIAHTHFAWAAVGPLKALPGSVPVVRTFHGPWDEEGWVEERASASGLPGLLKARAKRIYRRRIEAADLRRSRRITVLSDFFSNDVIRRFGIPAAWVVKIPGGADVERFTPGEGRAAARRALSLPQDKKILLSIRRLAPRMGLDNLIQAMPAIVAKQPDALLLIGGRGPHRDTLEKAIRETGMEDHVRLIGFVPDEQLADYYRAADLFVLPTIALEGFGLVTVEALACGTPALGTQVGGTTEILGGLDKRLIASGTTPVALKEGILSFLTGDWAKTLMPERLRGYVLENYTWDRHVSAVEAVYREVLAEAGKEPGRATSVSPVKTEAAP